MRTLFGLIVLSGVVAAQESKVSVARSSVVGVTAQRVLEMGGRTFNMNTRQMGIVIGKSGLILTTSLGDEPRNTRVFRAGSTEAIDAEVVDSDANFTLLKVDADGDDWTPLKFTRGWRPMAGEKLTWIGILAGSAGRWSPVAKGATVDAIITDDASATPLVYSDPPFTGPVTTLSALVLNAAGDAVGIVGLRENPARQGGRGGGGRRGFRRPQGIPMIRTVEAFAQYLDGKVSARGIMGVVVEALAPKVAEAMGIKGTRAVIVTQVTPGSGAEAAGLQAQDIVTKVGDMPVHDSAGLQAALRGKEPGTKVEVTLVRIGDAGPEHKKVTVTLSAREKKDKTKRFRARRFGFNVEPLTADHRRAQQLPVEVTGVHVRRVTAGGPGAMGRPTALRRGDVIMRVGQVPITDVKSLREALKACPDGKPVTLFLRKGKDTRFVEVTPEKE